jgi:hypothetical protein
MPTLPGDFTPGDVLAAADMNALPGGVVGFSTKSSDQSVTGGAGAVDITGMSVTFTALAGRRYKISATISVAGASDNARWVCDFIKGASTNVGILGRFESTDGGNDGRWTFSGFALDSPSAGSVTYKLAASREAGTGNITFQGNALRLAHFLVEDIGPA